MLILYKERHDQLHTVDDVCGADIHSQVQVQVSNHKVNDLLDMQMDSKYSLKLLIRLKQIIRCII